MVLGSSPMQYDNIFYDNILYVDFITLAPNHIVNCYLWRRIYKGFYMLTYLSVEGMLYGTHDFKLK